VIGRIARQANGQAKGIDELDQSLHELSATGVVFRAVVLVNQQGLHPWKAPTHRHPEQQQAVHDAVAGDARRNKVQVGLAVIRQENAKGDQRRIGSEVVVRRLNRDPRPSPTRKWPDNHRRFAIDREAQYGRVPLGFGVLPRQFGEDRIRLG